MKHSRESYLYPFTNTFLSSKNVKIKEEHTLMFCFLDDRDSGMFDPFLLLLFVTASDRLIMIGGNAVGGGGTNVAT